MYFTYGMLYRVRDDGLTSAGRAFVTFKTIEDAGSFVADYLPTGICSYVSSSHSSPTPGERQTSPHAAGLEIDKWIVERAPEPEDVMWENANVGKVQHRVRVFLLNFGFFWLTTVLLTPVAFTNGFSSFTDKNLGSAGQLFADYIPVLTLFL